MVGFSYTVAQVARRLVHTIVLSLFMPSTLVIDPKDTPPLIDFASKELHKLDIY